MSLPDVPVDKLASYPQFAFALAAVVFVVSVATVVRAFLKGGDARAGAPSKVEPVTEMHFGGPIAEALKALNVIASSVTTMMTALTVQLPETLKKQHDEMGARLREDRSKIYERIETERRELDAIDTRQDERMNDFGERLARLEGRAARGR